MQKCLLVSFWNTLRSHGCALCSTFVVVPCGAYCKIASETPQCGAKMWKTKRVAVTWGDCLPFLAVVTLHCSRTVCKDQGVSALSAVNQTKSQTHVNPIQPSFNHTLNKVKQTKNKLCLPCLHHPPPSPCHKLMSLGVMKQQAQSPLGKNIVLKDSPIFEMETHH